MNPSFAFLVAIGISSSLAGTLACSAKTIVDMGSNDVATGGTTSTAAPGTGGVTSSTGGTTSLNPSTGGAPVAPFEIIAGGSRITEIVADSGWVYWSAANGGSGQALGQGVATLSMRRYSAAADAGAVNTSELAKILTSPYPPPQGLTFDGDWMYWHGESYNPDDINRVYRCRKSGCSDVEDMGISGSFAVADGELFWSSGASIMRCDADNCSATTRTMDIKTPPGQLKFQGASSLAVDGDYLYMAFSGGLARVPLAGSTTYEAIAPHDPYIFFISGDLIYWVEFTNSNAVYSCPKSGCTGDPTPVMRNISHAQRMAHDNDSIYVVDGSGWELRRCPITGCDMPDVVLASKFGTLSMASDNENIFAVVSGSAYTNDYCSPTASNCNIVVMIPK